MKKLDSISICSQVKSYDNLIGSIDELLPDPQSLEEIALKHIEKEEQSIKYNALIEKIEKQYKSLFSNGIL